MSSTDTPTEDTVEETAPDRRPDTTLAEPGGELGDALVGSHLEPGIDLTVRVTAGAWADAAAFLRRGMGFGYFNFLSAIDWLPSPFGRDMDAQVDIALAASADPEPASDGAGPADAGAEMTWGLAGGETRFQVFARVNDVVNHRGLTLKVDVPEDSLTVPSWVTTYPGANWHEREAWEMFGITFAGHPGLRHIYLPGEFEGNPMRKDFPLLARRVKPWPGIVDVEAMPGDDEDEDDAAADAGEGNA